MAIISIQDLEKLCLHALKNAGLRDQDVEITIDHFLENELSGKSSHGIVRVVEAVKAAQKYGAPNKDPEIEKDTGNMVTLDGHGQIGVVAARHAMDVTIKRAKEHGLALGGVRNYIASAGSMAYYLRRLANQNLIALMSCNSVAQVCPPGGRERVIGTNPVGIAIPGESGEALIADFATSAIAYGKIMVMKDKGESIPGGLLIDKDGNPSTNPADAYDGAILPLADYRGFALGLMVELLAGPLIGAKAIKKGLYDNDGLFMIVINPEHLGYSGITEQISEALHAIKQTPPQPGTDFIALPGERSLKTLNEAKTRGTINVADKTLNNLKVLAEGKNK